MEPKVNVDLLLFYCITDVEMAKYGVKKYRQGESDFNFHSSEWPSGSNSFGFIDVYEKCTLLLS